MIHPQLVRLDHGIIVSFGNCITLAPGMRLMQERTRSEGSLAALPF
jgi:hypothetical protein